MRRTIPPDDEPLTPADMRAIREADAAFARGDYCTVDDLEADLGRLAADRARTGIGVSRAFDNARDFLADLHRAIKKRRARRHT